MFPQVRLLATNFSAAATAAGPSIRQFFAQQPTAKRQRTGGGSADGVPAGKSTAAAVAAAIAPIVDAGAGGQGMSAAGGRKDAAMDCPPCDTARAGVWGAVDSISGPASPSSTLTPPDEDGNDLVGDLSASSHQHAMPPAGMRGGDRGGGEAAAGAGGSHANVGGAAAAAGSRVAADGAAGRPGQDVDLAAIDVEEQRRILLQLRGGRGSGGRENGSAGREGATGGAKCGGARQQGIAEAFRRAA